MISYAKQKELKDYLEERVNVIVSFRPSARDMVVSVTFPNSMHKEIICDSDILEDFAFLKYALHGKILEMWKEVIKKK